MTRWSKLLLALTLIVSLAGEVWAETTPIISTETTNTTSAPIFLSVGPKSFYGIVSGTGAVSQTQAIYGAPTNTNIQGVLLCTITLAGTTVASDACPVILAPYPYYYVITTDTIGTNAAGTVLASQ